MIFDYGSLKNHARQGSNLPSIYLKWNGNYFKASLREPVQR